MLSPTKIFGNQWNNPVRQVELLEFVEENGVIYEVKCFLKIKKYRVDCLFIIDCICRSVVCPNPRRQRPLDGGTAHLSRRFDCLIVEYKWMIQDILRIRQEGDVCEIECFLYRIRPVDCSSTLSPRNRLHNFFKLLSFCLGLACLVAGCFREFLGKSDCCSSIKVSVRHAMSDRESSILETFTLCVIV